MRGDLGDQADQPRLAAGGRYDLGAAGGQSDAVSRPIPLDAPTTTTTWDARGFSFTFTGFLGFVRSSALD